MKKIMSVDVEEWFHIPLGNDNILPFNQWDSAVQRVQHVIPRLLDIFDQNETTATFFFLGWVAEKHPQLVKEVFSKGHEIATHGYAHKLIYNQTPKQFNEDIYKAKSILENLTGNQVIGYRAPGFSIMPETAWALEILSNNGIKYDSSVFPAKRYYGHFENFSMSPIVIKNQHSEIIEFPQTLISLGFVKYSCFGGGYFRLFPKSHFLMMAKVLEKKNRPLIMYIHPRDMDLDQPQISFSTLKRIRHYINISKTEQKLLKITNHFKFNSFEQIISNESYVQKLKRTYI